MKPKLITFDFGDTLVSSDPPYLKRIWMALEKLGLKFPLEKVVKSFHLADLKISKELVKKREFEPIDYQRGLGEALLEELEVKEKPDQVLKEMIDWLIQFRPERVLMPGALELLEELKKRGYQMGIISNNDGRTREKCREVGIENYFKFILDSTLEGMMKPDRRFFLKAIDEAKTTKKDVLHFGDLWGSDILGAHNAGISAVWLKNPYISPPSLKGVYKVNNYKEFLELLD